MEKKVLTGAVAFIVGGIVAKAVKTIIDKRKELIEGAIENNEVWV